MTISTEWLPVLVVLYTLAGFIAGWMTCASRSRGAAPDEGEQAPARVGRALESASKAIARHGSALKSFRSMLEGKASSEVSRPALRHQAKRIEADSLAVEHDLTVAVSQLRRSKADEHRADADLREQLEKYRGEAAAVRTQLQSLLGHGFPESLVRGAVQSISQLLDVNGRLQQELSTARQRLLEAEREARTDPLSKLPNRRAFVERAEELLSIYRRTGHPFSLILLDADHFKAVNDEHGHAAGDAALAMLARVLRETARATDHVSRLGGEEFAVLLPHTGMAQAMTAAERLRARIERSVLKHAGIDVRVTVSAGAAEIQPAETTDDLVARADAALYEAKQTGRNRVCGEAEQPEAESATA